MSGKKGMHRMGRPRKFDIRKEDLERLRKAGYGRTAIAAVYGCNDTTIRHWLIKYGMPTTLPRIPPSRLHVQRLLSAPRTRMGADAVNYEPLQEWPAHARF